MSIGPVTQRTGRQPAGSATFSPVGDIANQPAAGRPGAATFIWPSSLRLTYYQVIGHAICFRDRFAIAEAFLLLNLEGLPIKVEDRCTSLARESYGELQLAFAGL